MRHLVPGSGDAGPDYGGMHRDIVALLEGARHAAARSVNALMTASYWEIGRRIVEFEQAGQERAAYGQALLKRLSVDLTQRFGRGFSERNLEQMRLFYLAWPPERISQTPSAKLAPTRISQTESGESSVPAVPEAPIRTSAALSTLAQAFPLPWSAYVRLLSVKSEAARAFYETEALRCGWSVRQLEALTEKSRQVHAHLDAADDGSDALLLSLHHKLAAGRVVRLGDVIELREIDEPITPAGTYPQVGVRGFGGGLFAKAAVSGTETKYRSFHRLYEGAIVLSQVKGWEGAIARCPAELSGWFVSPEYRTFRCKQDQTSSEYIGEIVRTEWFWQQLQDATQGVGARRERTRPERFLNIELVLPTLSDQLRIVEVLKRQTPLKAKHAAIRQANATLLPATLERVFSSTRQGASHGQ